MSKVRISLVLSVTLVTLICALLLTSSRADGRANDQKRNMRFGVSGGSSFTGLRVRVVLTDPFIAF